MFAKIHTTHQNLKNCLKYFLSFGSDLFSLNHLFNQISKPVRQSTVLSLIFILTFYPPLSFASSPVEGLTPDGSTNTTVGYTANGTPYMNTATTGANGTSINRMSDFNVGSKNLAINNFAGSSGNMAINSNLAGIVQANPNLAVSGAARNIIAEVTSDRFSAINGYVEIVGQRADLVIANPNGISVNGGGFINTSRLSLVAGRPNMDGSGNVIDYTIGGTSQLFSPSDIAGQVLITARDVDGAMEF
jgi:filamentous hemagglutinin family protein